MLGALWKRVRDRWEMVVHPIVGNRYAVTVKAIVTRSPEGIWPAVLVNGATVWSTKDALPAAELERAMDDAHKYLQVFAEWSRRHPEDPTARGVVAQDTRSVTKPTISGLGADLRAVRFVTEVRGGAGYIEVWSGRVLVTRRGPFAPRELPGRAFDILQELRAGGSLGCACRRRGR